MTNTISTDPHARNISSFAVNQNHKTFGKYWAAVEGPRVVSLILIPTIADKDKFNNFRDKSREALSIVGEVVTGEIQERNGVKVLVKRLPRNNNTNPNAKSRIEPTFSIPYYLQ